VTDQLQKTAMVYAAGTGHPECVGALLDGGVDVNARYKHQLTALMWAAASGSLPTVELLLQRGADVSARDDRGKTALDIATDERQTEIARRLSAGSGSQGASTGP
jgi:ankyrin repeat protein